jgi:glycolate oxidase FAD binding subunit
MSEASGLVRPSTYQEAAAALGTASERHQSVRIRGAGTKDYLGDLRPTDLILETTALRGIVAHVPADLTVTVAAGTPFAELRAMLAQAGQFLPLDPPHGEAATIGGVVAANSTGFWRARYGGVRDLLIGTTTALADGTLARAGGRVVKNVAGYDVNKLLIGSLGTLGVIVECTFKILPVPKASAGLQASFARGSAAFAAADAVARTPARPAALVVESTARESWRLLVLAQGDPSAVERTLTIATAAAEAQGGTAERHDDIELGLGPLRELSATTRGTVIRASLPPAAQNAFADVATRLAGFRHLVADAASGVVRIRVQSDESSEIAAADALRAAARVCGGSAHIERRPDAIRDSVSAWGDGDVPGLFLMKRLKDAFDPNGVLEPGRGVVR